MSYPQSPEYQFEQAIVPLFSSIAGLNVYTTNRTGSRLFPYVTISARQVRQMVTPYSGVYEVEATISYSNTSAKYTATQFDEQYLDIFAGLYEVGQELNSKIQENAIDLLVYMARISEQTPTILANKRAWVRGIKLSAIITPDENIDSSRAYIFSEELNSFYLATI